MTRKPVAFSRAAIADLDAMFARIAARAGREHARGVIRKIEDFAEGLSTLSDRGAPRPEVAPGLRILVLPGRATLLYRSLPDRVLVARIIPPGRPLPRGSR